MTGDDLLLKLQAMTPEDRKKEVICSYWNNGDADSSGWEETKDVDSCNVGEIRHYSSNIEAIILG